MSNFKFQIANKFQIPNFQFFSSVFSVVVLLVWLFVPIVSLAHNSGASFEREVGEYKIDIGYDPVTLTLEEPMRLDFEVLNIATQTKQEFDRVWVRIHQGNSTLLATGVGKSSFGPTTMVYDFPSPGNYSFYVRFEKESKGFVEATFDLTVVSDEAGSSSSSAKPDWLIISLVGFASLAIGFGVGFLLGRRGAY